MLKRLKKRGIELGDKFKLENSFESFANEYIE